MGQQITAVWQNGGFSAKFNISSSIELLCKTDLLYFDFRHFAKLQTVICNPYRATAQQTTDGQNPNNLPHIAAHLQAAQKPTQRPKLAKELQFCQRTQAHPPPKFNL